MCGKNDEYINVSGGQVQQYIDGKNNNHSENSYRNFIRFDGNAFCVTFFVCD